MLGVELEKLLKKDGSQDIDALLKVVSGQWRRRGQLVIDVRTIYWTAGAALVYARGGYVTCWKEEDVKAPESGERGFGVWRRMIGEW